MVCSVSVYITLVQFFVRKSFAIYPSYNCRLAVSKMERTLTFGSLIFCLVAVLHTEARVVTLSENALEEIQQVLRYADPTHKMPVEKTGCSCINDDCGCCLDLSIQQIKFKDVSCVNMTYLPEQYGLEVTFTINKFTVINVTVSAKNPPPICFGVPHFEDFASICIDFYDLDVENKTFHGCVKVQFRLFHVINVNENFGCFRIPLLGKDGSEQAKHMVQSLERSRKLTYLGGW